MIESIRITPFRGLDLTACRLMCTNASCVLWYRTKGRMSIRKAIVCSIGIALRERLCFMEPGDTGFMKRSFFAFATLSAQTMLKEGCVI